jgi:hypothetical protein
VYSLVVLRVVWTEERGTLVRKTPSWPRSWATFSLLSLYSHWNAWANLRLLECMGQPNIFLARAGHARGAEEGGVGQADHQQHELVRAPVRPLSLIIREFSLRKQG